MPARQYKPFSYSRKNIPLIIYPVKDENPLEEVFDVNDVTSIQQHLNELYEHHDSQLNKGRYHVVFVWNLDGHRMTDVWIHNLMDWSGESGPILECITFRDLETCNDAGIASGDSIIALGREEELRRQLNDFEKYIDRANYIPKFPIGMQPIVDFYRSSKGKD